MTGARQPDAQRVPFFDYLRQYERLSVRLDAAVARVLHSGRLVLDREVKAFEEGFAGYCACAYGIGVNSGTDAIQVALRAVGVGEGDEVITVPNTSVGTVSAICSAGARPVFADVLDRTHLIDPSEIEKRITPRTKAVVPVHLYGMAAEMGPIMEIARRRGLAIVEDCAQSHGAEYQGKKTGSIGHAGCFSFYPTKNLGAFGDGGMVVTSDPGIAARAREIRTYGWERRDMSVRQGINSRLDELQAAVLREKLPFLDDWNQHRYEHAMQYKQLLSGLPIGLPSILPGMFHVFHLFVIRTARRDDLMAFLAGRGIATLIHYPVPLHLQPASPSSRNSRGWSWRRCAPPSAPFSRQAVEEMTGEGAVRSHGNASPPAGRAPDGAGNVRRVTSAVFWNFFGKTFLLGVRFAESVILVRLLGREEYGLYGSLINLEAIAVLVISLGLESAVSRFVPQFRAEGDAGKIRSLLGRIFRLRALLLLPAGAAVIFGGGFISATFYHGLLPQGLLNAVFALVVIVSFHSLFRTFLDSFFHVKFISMVDAATQGAYLLLAVLMVRSGYGLGGVFLALVLSQGTAALLLWNRFGSTLRREVPVAGTGRSGVGKRRVISYSWSLYLFGILLYVLGKGMDVLLIGVLLGDMVQVAWYMIAFNLAYYSLSVMDIAVSANFIVSLIVEANTAGNLRLLRKIFTGLFEFIYVYALPVAAGGLILAPSIVRFVYGAENGGAALLMVVFIAAMTVGKLSSVTSYFLVVLDRERVLVIARTLFGAVNLVLDLYLIPRYGALGAVLATSAVMVAITLFEAFLVWKILSPRYNPLFLVKTAAAAAAMAAVVAGGHAVWGGPVGVTVPVLVAAGGAVYLLGIRILGPFSDEVRDLLSKTEYPFRSFILKLLAIRPAA
jgi:dTDP-4-amino-4,6-dideoxygalactose transaminase/O-antigen/teichoic acid export membrane protein